MAAPPLQRQIHGMRTRTRREDRRRDGYTLSIEGDRSDAEATRSMGDL